jgi:signal peptidase I
MTRKPWVAAALSLCAPGVGHVYAGNPRRGAIIWLIVASGFTVFWYGYLAAPSYEAILIGRVLVIATLAAVAVDAVRLTKHQPPLVERWTDLRWYVYLALIPTADASILVAQQLAGRHFRPFRIPTASMAPTLLPGDQITTQRVDGPVARGDIIIFFHAGVLYTKRAVAIGGDIVAMRHDTLFVNGRGVDEPYVRVALIEPKADLSLAYSWGPVTVPAHAYFVLGDNRDNSSDSRAYGPIVADSVIYRPIAIYYSKDSLHHVRTRRIGMHVDR